MATPKSTQSLTPVLSVLPARQQRALASMGGRVVKTLSDVLGEQVRLSDGDRIRSIRFVAWARHWDVPLRYVVEKALEWGAGAAGAKIKYRRRKNVLPLGIPSLTGPACQAFVGAQVELERPPSASTEFLRSTMMQGTMESVESMPVRKPLEYASMDQFTAAYAERITQQRGARERALRVLSQTKPFRGNPFR